MQESAPYYKRIFKEGSTPSYLEHYQHAVNKAFELCAFPDLKTIEQYKEDTCLMFSVVGEADKSFLTLEQLLKYYRRKVELPELLLTVIRLSASVTHDQKELDTAYYKSVVVSMICLDKLNPTEEVTTTLVTHNLKYEHLYVTQASMLQDLIHILSEDGVKALGEKYNESMRIASERKNLPLEKGDIDLFVSLSTMTNMAKDQLIYSNLTTLLQREEPTHVGDILILFINSKQISSVTEDVFHYTGDIYQSLKLQYDFMKPNLLNLLPGHKNADENKLISFNINDKDTGEEGQITMRKLSRPEIDNTLNYLERFDELSDTQRRMTIDSIKSILKRLEI